MRAYRLVAKQHAARAFTGEGARIAGGRWNHKGRRMVYCSESRALAAMELFVNLDPVVAPAAFVIIAVDVADALIERLKPSALPRDWRAYPAPEALQDIGARWLDSKRSVGLLVPSAVIPDEQNLLLNPEHPQWKRVKRRTPAPFAFDPRMWKA